MGSWKHCSCPFDVICCVRRDRPARLWMQSLCIPKKTTKLDPQDENTLWSATIPFLETTYEEDSQCCDVRFIQETYAAPKHGDDLELVDLPFRYVGGEAAMEEQSIKTQGKVELEKSTADGGVREPVPAVKATDTSDDGNDPSEGTEDWSMASKATPQKPTIIPPSQMSGERGRPRIKNS